jgi:hypothetical protein
LPGVFFLNKLNYNESLYLGQQQGWLAQHGSTGDIGKKLDNP